MGSPLSPLLANVFMCSIEDKLDEDGKLPSCYRRYVDDTFTIMPDIASAGIFLDTLNRCHPSAKFTMVVERNASLLSIGVEVLNLAPRIKTKVYIKHGPCTPLLEPCGHPVQAQCNYYHVRSCLPHIFRRVLLLTRMRST